MEVDRYKLADEIRKSYLKHGNDSWVSIANDILPLSSVSKRLFDVTYQGQDDEGLIVRTITVMAENESEAAEKVRQCGLQLMIYDSNAC